MLEVSFHHGLLRLLGVILLDGEVSEVESHALDEACRIVSRNYARVAHSVPLAVEVDAAFGHCRVKADVSCIQINLEGNRRG